MFGLANRQKIILDFLLGLVAVPQIFQISEYLHKQCREIGGKIYYKHNLKLQLLSP